MLWIFNTNFSAEQLVVKIQKICAKNGENLGIKMQKISVKKYRC